MVRVRRAVGIRAAGHAGTLDPFATGLLVVLLGRATRLARFVERQDKGYLAEAVLGIATDTDDVDGRVIAERRPTSWPGAGEIRDLLSGFVGTHLQRPPAYSARRVAGRRGYRMARRGEAVELAATPVSVRAIELVDWEPPRLRFRVAVSAGTYVRALARDFGERLGTGAHLCALRREWVGPLRVEDAVPLDRIGPESPVLAPVDLVGHLVQVPLDPDGLAAVRHGRAIPSPTAAGQAALVDAGRLVAVAEAVDGAWRPRVVLEPA